MLNIYIIKKMQAGEGRAGKPFINIKAYEVSSNSQINVILSFNINHLKVSFVNHVGLLLVRT